MYAALCPIHSWLAADEVWCFRKIGALVTHSEDVSRILLAQKNQDRGTGGNGGDGLNGGGGGMGEGPRVKMTVKNIKKTYSALPTAPSNFRTIPLGDIDLQRNIQMNGSGFVTLRRLHSAKVVRDGADVACTVAVYQGHGAEEEWRRDTANHPNLVQLYGIATCGNMHVTVFHDDLIPLEEFVDFYSHSHFASVYILAYMTTELSVAQNYLSTVFRHVLPNYTLFIRHSTGGFCIDLESSAVSLVQYPGPDRMLTGQGLKFLADENSEATIIDSLTLNHYHSISYWVFSRNPSISISTSQTIHLGSVFTSTSEGPVGYITEIAWCPNVELEPCEHSWNIAGRSKVVKEIMADGWTRFDAASAHAVWVTFWPLETEFWPSQANHIFTTLQISSDFQDYIVLESIRFEIKILTLEEQTGVSAGFLFLCPLEDFQMEPSSFEWPDCPAYWALDALGTERLTTEDAINRGFPSLMLSTEVQGKSWDASVMSRGIWATTCINCHAFHLRILMERLTILATMMSATIAPHHSKEYDNAFESPPTDPSEDDGTSRYLTAAECPSDAPESTLNIFTVKSPDVSPHEDTEEIPIPNIFKVLMNVQLSLIIFSAVCWVLYEV
ncbi:hypothetical protein MSAN_00295600 [Mycena sanguinolenta]|uniref:Protein kinase domain-containing protein n=1 Tax=Mycena sanguinolenta TaxID=230812 RepID=A0A8H7DI76_9AGAR|nr:hypothetical protein MSAN_00295600 [Mycena sanguinolenta]